MQESISDLIMHQQLRWLGHVGRMNKERLPKRVLFGELRKRRPCHGVKKRWRDVDDGKRDGETWPDPMSRQLV